VLTQIGKTRTGKTVQTYAEAISAFCGWCVKNKLLDEDPLAALTTGNTEPTIKRRVLTIAELQQLFATCYPVRRLTYETAVLSGLRAGELRSLSLTHLDAARGGLKLDPAWTKNRETGFQPLPAWLISKLATQAIGKPPTAKLLYVPLHLHRPFDHDLTRAGLEKKTADGKLDFHSLRVAYDNLILDCGATVKEAQTWMRHSDPRLTMNTYGRTRNERLSNWPI
jgi:integrase